MPKWCGVLILDLTQGRMNTQAAGIKKRRRSLVRGFTLVELLVVIAVIGLLAALGVPALSRAIRAANQGECMANLRQIGILMQGYAADNNGMTVQAWDDITRLNFGEILLTWKGRMDADGKIGGGFENWRCPENKVQFRCCGSEGGERAGSYSINGWNDTLNGSPDNRYAGNRVANFASPSKLYMVSEAAYFRIEAQNDGGGSLPTGLYTTGGRHIRYAHSGRVNMVFADGHGELLPPGPLVWRGTYLGGEDNKAASFSNGKPWHAN